MSTYRRLLQTLSIVLIASLMLSGFGLPAASAQGKDGLKRQLNAQTGKVSLLSPESGRVLSASKALGTVPGIRPADPAMALAKRFGGEFGLKNSERDLKEVKTKRQENGRMTVHYQQNYEGIPVLGGELVVNTNENGDLYSINGEISPDLSVQTQPAVDAEQARQTALQGAAKWYQKAPEDFLTSEPELWIYDESLLRPSTRPVELVWRMEVTPKETDMPVRELVLVNAERGTISLHFNQVDTAWRGTEQEKTAPVLNTTQENTESNVNSARLSSTSNEPAMQTGSTWYVATTGSDTNSCSDPASPCATINGAIGKAAAGDTIKVAVGTYTGSGTEVVLVNKNVTLSGGWNANFTTQNGQSIIDGQGARRGITVYTNITAIVERVLIQNGRTLQGGGIYIHSNGTFTLNSSTVRDNTATWGGGAGVYIKSGAMVTLNNGTVSSNDGTGVQNYGTLTLNTSTISASTNSGIFNSGGTLILNNSTISGNSGVGSGGGGILNESGTTTLNNSTVSDNITTFGPGGGIYNLGGPVTLKHTIIAVNSAKTTGPDCAGTIGSTGYNLIGNNGGCLFSMVTGDVIGTNSNPIKPRLAPLQDNGGPTFTHALMVGSPAIDAGNPAIPGSGGNTCLGTDERGVTRPVGERCDIGAYEGSVPFTLLPVITTYTAGGSSSLPGTFICSQADPTCSRGDSHAKAAHQYAIGTYDFYAAQHGRDSLDNNGMTIISTVHYSPNYANASWNGEQIIYGDVHDYPLADDVVAHEFTHGVTQYESNLLYYYQSGAINESLSDLWGEYYDQSNGLGTDTDGVKWEIGEDAHDPELTRSMSDPTIYGDPDRMSSSLYYAGEADSGGVHHNSGINNKAAFLMVNGGDFNTKTVSPLGWVKTAAIYYEANTNLITSGADYSDLYYMLQQACSNLVGQKGIELADCAEVKDAVEAVEMHLEPRPAFNADAPYCPAGTTMTPLFLDDLESGTGNWTFNNGAYPRWQVNSSFYGRYARSGLNSLYADDFPAVVTDATARLGSFEVPFDTYLRFSHAYEFETGYYLGSFRNFDGGVLEYSISGGSTWQDADPLIEYNDYGGVLFTGADNPLSGRWAFVGSSHGYLSTRVNLASLVGKTVSFRWRMGLDEFMDAGGWWVDDVEIYQCIDPTANVSVTIGDTLVGKRTVNAQPSLLMNFPDRLDGPVKVIGKDGLPIVTSQRVVFGTSFNELMGYPADQFTTEYWFPWYDMVYMNTWVLVGNPSTTQTAYVDIYIGGVKQGQTYAIPPGDRVLPQFPGVLDGPVRVVSVTGAGTPTALPIFASERSTYLSSFNEVMGYPADQFTTEYWFPWYDQMYMNTWILVGNPSSTQTAYVDVYIGGIKQNQTYAIPPSGRILPQFPGLIGGPVRVVSTTGAGTSTPLPVFASERSTFQGSFNEVMGYPADRFTTEYWYTWYDNLGMASWVLVGNPSTTQTAYVDIYIAGIKQGSTFVIPPSGSVIPRFNLSSGPVRILSVTGAGTPTAIPVFTSERSLYGPSFNEVMGYPADQLSSEYWFTWYDSIYMTTELYVSKP